MLEGVKEFKDVIFDEIESRLDLQECNRQERKQHLDTWIENFLNVARRYGEIQINKCNRELSKREGRLEAKLSKMAIGLADKYGFRVKLGGDPRGYTVKLLLPSGKHNTWGGKEDGWGVPGS